LSLQPPPTGGHVTAGALTWGRRSESSVGELGEPELNDCEVTPGGST